MLCFILGQQSHFYLTLLLGCEGDVTLAEDLIFKNWPFTHQLDKYYTAFLKLKLYGTANIDETCFLLANLSKVWRDGHHRLAIEEKVDILRVFVQGTNQFESANFYFKSSGHLRD